MRIGFGPQLDLFDSVLLTRLLAALRVSTVALFCLVGDSSAIAQEADSGRAIYRAMCASCHGNQGQGSAEADEPLVGDLDVVRLASLIQKTMPEDKPGTLSDDRANAVAHYVYDNFYSADARLRTPLARIELAHLAVEQYRQTLMDLVETIASNGNTIDDSEDRGLTAEYFDGQTPYNRKLRKLKRIDANVDFDFGTQPPVKELNDPRRFSVRWSGSVFAPETGNYTFAVHSGHAVKFYLNSRKPRMDAWVKSAGDDKHSVDVYLVGGRRYPLLLEFSKSKQGVDDSKKKNKKPPVAAADIALKWTRPHGVQQTIPTRYLSPHQTSVRYVSSIQFPPDDRSYGWIRATSVSKAWDQATTLAAMEATAYLRQRLDRLLKTISDDISDDEKMKRICRKFMQRAFRKPLDDVTVQNLIDRPFEQATEPQQAFKRVILYTLKSPQFLYREIDQPEQYMVASRLSFGLWDSLPDDSLLEAAETNQLASEDHIRQHAQQMLDDPRTAQKLRRFLLSWLQVDTHHELAKDESSFPGFDQAAIADMRTSLELEINDVIESADADFRQLLGSDEVYLNSRLAKLFDVNPIESDEFSKVKLDSDYRAGLLTHPYILAQFAYRSESSPIHRGVFVARNILGTRLRPPPEAFAPLSPKLHNDLTTRQRVTLQTRPAQCMSCHQTINPLGFAFEHFDAVGRVRVEDRGKPIDSKAVVKLGEQTIELQNARQLTEFVTRDPQSQAAFCEQLFHFLVGQSINAYGHDTREKLQKSFVSNDYNIRLLAREIVVIAAMTGHQTGNRR